MCEASPAIARVRGMPHPFWLGVAQQKAKQGDRWEAAEVGRPGDPLVRPGTLRHFDSKAEAIQHCRDEHALRPWTWWYVGAVASESDQ